MPKPLFTQSQKRLKESLAAHFQGTEEMNRASSMVFLKSSSDTGVIRNGGRNGARFAPQSFLTAFKRLTLDSHTQNFTFTEFEVSSPRDEENDFSKAQENEAKVISSILHQNKNSRICHIGGGHDHIYPLLKALAGDYESILVLNIDAHADTRDDLEPHSGTPFRQFSQSFSGQFHLAQIGLHPFANSKSTLSDIEMSILWKEELQDKNRIGHFFENLRLKINSKTLVVFSLDADAMSGSQVPGVSAVNGDGLSMEDLQSLWAAYENLISHPPVLGIYELNPLYDTLSMLSMRVMAAFLYKTLK